MRFAARRILATFDEKIGAGQSRSKRVMPNKDTFRVVTRETDGKLRIKDYPSDEPIKRRHSQVGIDDCSTDLALRGMPVFRGLIGPIPEGSNIVRYESPEVFESLTKEWGANGPKRRRRSRISQS
jgi:hypothetical protein